MIRSIVHLLLHFIVPGSVAKLGFPKKWKKAWVIMISTMIVDLDHLLAVPVFNPERCSIGFHPLHSYFAVFVYLLLTIPGKTRFVGLGLVIHMALDGIDCVWIGFG